MFRAGQIKIILKIRIVYYLNYTLLLIGILFYLLLLFCGAFFLSFIFSYKGSNNNNLNLSSIKGFFYSLSSAITIF